MELSQVCLCCEDAEFLCSCDGSYWNIECTCYRCAWAHYNHDDTHDRINCGMCFKVVEVYGDTDYASMLENNFDIFENLFIMKVCAASFAGVGAASFAGGGGGAASFAGGGGGAASFAGGGAAGFAGGGAASFAGGGAASFAGGGGGAASFAGGGGGAASFAGGGAAGFAGGAALKKKVAELELEALETEWPPSRFSDKNMCDFCGLKIRVLVQNAAWEKLYKMVCSYIDARDRQQDDDATALEAYEAYMVLVQM